MVGLDAAIRLAEQTKTISMLFRYLLNPYTVGSCLAQSTTTFDNTLVLLAIGSAAQG